ncbi:hypothetical protein CYD30_26180 [Kosakonia cowanii]|nr:hypothetical protein CYD30_26180 [Kosakonia cowanii]
MEIKKVGIIFLSLLAFNSCAADSFDIRWKDNLPIIDAKIGTRWHSLIVDTGSANGFHLYNGNFMLNDGVLATEDKPLKASDLSGDDYILRRWLIDDVNLNSHVIKHSNIVEKKSWGATAYGDNVSNPDDEVIGLGAFTGENISFLFKENRLIINDDSGVNMPRSLPITLSKDGVIVAVYVNGKSLNFILDTAATVSVVFYDSLPKNATFKSCTVVDKSAASLDCNVISGEIRPLSGGAEEIDLIAMYANSENMGFNGILGINFLKKHNFTIALKDRQLLLDE